MKKSTAAALTLGALAAAMLACQAVTGQSRTPTPLSPPEPTPIAPEVADLTGTRWLIYYYEPGGDYYEYELVFHPAGRLENSHPNESTPYNDAWRQTGDTVILLFNDSYATYEGRISGDTITGTAVNVAGGVWSWDAYQLP